MIKSLSGFTVTAAVFVAVLTACGPEDGSTPTPEPGPAVTESSVTEERAYETDLYLLAVRAIAPELEIVSDEDLVSLGESVCSAFGRGVTTGEVAEAMTGDDGLTGTQAGAVVGAATGSYGLCSEFGEVARGDEDTAAAQ